MNERQIKRKLEDDGKRISDLVRDLEADFPITLGSANTMLRDLIAGKRWFPVYAKWLEKKHGIVVDVPKPYRDVRERMKIAA